MPGSNREGRKEVSFEKEVKKDIFFKALLIYGFVFMYIVTLLHGIGWDKPFVVAVLLGTYVFLVIVAPHWFYDKLKVYYGIFDRKLSKIAGVEISREETGKAAFVFNSMLFIFFSFVAFVVSRVAGYFLFRENAGISVVIMIILDVLALWGSIKITNKKLRRK